MCVKLAVVVDALHYASADEEAATLHFSVRLIACVDVAPTKNTSVNMRL